ncbi:MAG TPA: pepsin-like aspartyl protease [Woeseiaceae bacterium]|nr:pepsin-like aspartyl protease [Woeseiaceae bacterium]
MNRTDATTAKASLALAVVAAMLGACRADSAPEATASEESAEIIPHIITLPMQRGPMADYGATPWYTDRIALGKSPMRLALDSGASFFWATSDLCTTQACNAHARVDTGQPGFVWLDKTPTTRSFGPWGNMTTWTGAVPLYIDGGPWQAIPFFASVDYSGAKFQYLTWGGGVGLPSESADVTPGSGFLIEMLYFKGGIPSPEFSMLTEPWTGTGFTWLGGRGDPTYFDPRSEVQLQPKKAAIGYLWGTNLYSVRLGGTPLPPLAGQTFFLDSGSSRFKGDAQYVYPIMQPLSQLRDAQGNLIFTPTYDDAGNWVGLYYTNGRPSDYPNLPDLTLTLGQTCYLMPATSLVVTLSPEQYSYYVEEGDQAGKWALGVHRLDGVGGLLVGSTFMDLLATRFTYRVSGSSLSQGDMYLYRKTQGVQPKEFYCISMETGEMVAAP